MSSEVPRWSSAAVYTDLRGLQGIHSSGQRQPQEGLRAAAQQFEALFLQMVLRSARQAPLAEGTPFNGEQVGFYRDLHEQQLALSLAASGRIGIAELIVEQFSDELSASEGRASPAPASSTPARQTEPLVGVATEDGRGDAPPSLPGGESAAPSAVVAADSPEAFVGMIWPAARSMAARLGIAPEAVVAHAALESGWGRGVPVRADGRSSYNFFGIKPGPRWCGPRVVHRTWEHVAGAWRSRVSEFRAYRSLAEGLADYADFLLANGRYRSAFGRPHQAEHFFSALQAAGYATDPDYANKLSGVLHSTALRQSLASLKTPPARPIME